MLGFKGFVYGVGTPKCLACLPTAEKTEGVVGAFFGVFRPLCTPMRPYPKPLQHGRLPYQLSDWHSLVTAVLSDNTFDCSAITFGHLQARAQEASCTRTWATVP